MKYAIIDISAGGVSLLIASVEQNKEVLHHERAYASILHYIEGGKLTQNGVDKIVEMLNDLKEICRENRVDKCYVVSTASLRNLKNSEWVAEEINRRAAVRVNRLEGEEEAYCDLLANAQYKSDEKSFLVDIGGGSIELCDLYGDGEESLAFFDFGPVQLNEQYVANVHPTEFEALSIKDYVKKKLKGSGLKKEKFETAVLVGANNQAICRVYRDYYGIAQKGGEIDCKKLKRMCEALIRSSKRNALILKNAPEHTHTLMTSAVILRTVLKYFDVKRIQESNVGVKDGYLIWLVDGKKEAVETDIYL